MCIGLLRVTKQLSVELLAAMLKSIKNITMAPAALEALQNTNAIETLVKIMSRHLDATVCIRLLAMVSIG